MTSSEPLHLHPCELRGEREEEREWEREERSGETSTGALTDTESRSELDGRVQSCNLAGPPLSM